MVKLTACLVALLGLATFASSTTVFGPGPDADLIKNLPGCDLKVPAYSGYLTVTDTKKLHYVFIGSQNKTTDPLVLWFNGGPGCSSLEGLFQEHGPCVLDEGVTQKDIRKNPFSWNLRANMVYIESPAGVGFSIAGTPEDKIHNDLSQANDLFIALQDFYAKFPDMFKNDLYISGESYAGIYVPYLAWKIYQDNLIKELRKKPLINLKGIMVGNGATDFTVDVSPSFPQTIYGM